MKEKSIIGLLMQVYRNSKFHNAKNGMILAKFLSRLILLMPQKQIEKEIDGIKYSLDLNQVIDSSLYFSNTFEPLSESIMEKFIKPLMTCVDIGANVGYHTFRMARLSLPGGSVFAIEPTTWAIQRLKKNLSLNPEFTNISIHQVAFSDTYLGKVNMSFKSSYSLQGKEQVESEDNILITTLDKFVDENKIEKIDFIKLDVDGLEGKIMKGSQKTIERDHPIILFEITPSELRKTDIDPHQFLIDLVEKHYSLYSDNLSLIKNLNIFIDNHKEGYSSMVLAYPGKL